MLKPHKFHKPFEQLKIPMPPPSKVLALEKLKDKGLEVEYPEAPWYTEYVAEKQAEADAAAKRKETPGEKLIP